MRSPGMILRSTLVLLFLSAFSIHYSAFPPPFSARVQTAIQGRVSARSLHVTAQVDETKVGDRSDGSDSVQSRFLPMAYAPPPPDIVIAAAHIDSAVSYEPDEAILLWNRGRTAQELAGWRIKANSSTASFPLTSTLSLEPGQGVWCSAEAVAFVQAFGFAPACEWDEESDPAVLNLNGHLTLANSGGSISVYNATGTLVDTLVYGDESRPIAGWHGLPAQLYARGAIGKVGQVWQRKLDPLTTSPIDSDLSTDWAGDIADLRWGRRVRMPGWRTGQVAQSPALAMATVSVATGPEGLYQPITDALGSAQRSIDLSLYTFEHPDLAGVLVAAINRGVAVRLLLEGGPAGGITDLQKWCLVEISRAGGQVRYLAPHPDAPTGYRPRYAFSHAKYALIDGRLAFNGTENFTLDAMPRPGVEPVGGRRGFYLFTDAAPVISELQAIFDHDWSPDRFLDLHPFERSHPKYGGPPDDFVLPEYERYSVVDAPFGELVSETGQHAFGVISAPENALDPDGGLLTLLDQADAGDEISVWQLYEHAHWGDTQSNAVADPNPRLEAMLDAARRGARVRLLLDSFFDEESDPRSNRTTATYVQAMAEKEGLDFQVQLGNPTGGGVHAKGFLFQIDGRRWSAIGSLNGGEVSHKLNREVVVLTDAPAVYDRLAQVFAWDWARSHQ